MIDGRKYRYGFEANQKQIISEWLYYVPKVRETRLFERNINSFKISKNYKANSLLKITRNNALFLSVSAQFNVDIAEKILDFVNHELYIIYPSDEELCLVFTIDCLIRDENNNEIIQLIKKLDLGIGDIQVEQRDFTVDALPKNVPDNLKQIALDYKKSQAASIDTIHKKFDKEKNYQSTDNF